LTLHANQSKLLPASIAFECISRNYPDEGAIEQHESIAGSLIHLVPVDDSTGSQRSRPKRMTPFRSYRNSYILLVLVLFLNCSLSLMAQEAAGNVPSISYEGQKVASVELAGKPNLNLRTMNKLIQQPINAPYRQERVDATVAALKRSGEFRDVKVEVTPEANGLRVLFVLQPAVYFGVFQFSKSVSRFPYTRLLQEADFPRQEPYTEGRVEQAESNLLDFFHQIGYFSATVEPALHENAALGVVNVEFLVKPGRHARFGKITIEGVSPAQQHRLLSSIASLWARVHGAYLRPGKSYSEKRLAHGQTALSGRAHRFGFGKIQSAHESG
jgi:outer membrane protein insertion porin family